MNKKVLSAILFSALFAGTGTFTSCIDNDEPAGIEELRGAKAELIRAKIAVEEANALAIAADAALTQAKAETEKAVAAYQKALADQQAEKVKQEALRTELQAAQNEADKARIQAEIAEAAVRQAEAEAAMVEAAKQHELNMKNMETSLLQYELAYQNALKDLKLAEVTLTSKQQAAVEAIKKEINGYVVYTDGSYQLYDWVLNPETNELEWRVVESGREPKSYEVQGLMHKLADADQALFDAQQKLAEAMYKKEAGNDVAEAEFAVKVAEHELADAKAAAAKVAELAAKEIASTDWEKESAALAEEIAAAKLELKALEIEEEKIHAENKFAYDTVQIAYDAVTTAGEKHAYTAYKNDYSANAALTEKVDAKLGTNGVLTFGDLDDATKNTFDVTYTWPTATTEAAYAYGVADDLLNDIKDWLEGLEEINISSNDAATAELGLAKAEKDVETAEEAYEVAVANWEIAKKIYTKAADAPTTVPTTAIAAARTAFDTGVASLKAKVDAYNALAKTTYETAYTAAYDKSIADQTAEKEAEELKKAYEAALAGTWPATVKDEMIKKGDAKTAYTNSSIKTVAQYNLIIDSYAQATTDANGKEVKAATNAASIKAAIAAVAADNVAVYFAKAANKKLREDAAVAAAVKAASDAETAALAAETATTAAGALNVALAAIDEEAKKFVKDVTDAAKDGVVAGLKNAYTAYENLAYLPYAQSLTADAEAAYAKIVLPTVYTDAYGAQDKATTKLAYTTYGLKVAAISDEVFAAITETEAVADVELVWKKASKNAFGLNDRVIAATEDEVLGAAKAANVTIDQFPGAMAAWLAAQDALAVVEGKISAKEDLEALIADVTAAKTKLEGEMAVAKAAVDAAVAEYNKKQAAYDELTAEIDEKIEAAKHEIATAERVMTTLNGVVKSYLNGLNYSFSYIDKNNIKQIVKFEYKEGEDNTANLKHFFEEWTLFEEFNVLTAEGEVKEAKAFLAMVKEGKYDAVAMETRLVEKAQAAYDLAKANLDDAYARLAALLDSFDAE